MVLVLELKAKMLELVVQEHLAVLELVALVELAEQVAKEATQVL